MRFSETFYGAITLANLASALCRSPEPSTRICYNETGHVPQDIDMAEVKWITSFLRDYQEQAIRERRQPFWKMSEAASRECTQLPITKRKGVQVVGKHIGDGKLAVLYSDIANTIEAAATASASHEDESLAKCGPAGGQMHVLINTTDPFYQAESYRTEGYSYRGLIVKLLRNEKEVSI